MPLFPAISFIIDNGRHAHQHRVESFVTPVRQPELTAPRAAPHPLTHRSRARHYNKRARIKLY